MTSTSAQRLAMMKNLPPPPPPPSGAEGIRVMYDEDLGSRLHFKEEIGFGNWGSVWLCVPYAEPPSHSSSGVLSDVKLASKLVHRSKTATTKARVQSLWNEWKIVTSLAPHPSIIDFYSFVVADSYALVTMAYHPRLVSVEVPEPYARDWFRSLLSGIEFLHSHGVVHNDIKPANILLSTSNVPVLVDFGFAKQYDPQAPDAFHSNLSYGTPEYLSPERAAGHLHDTRKSDIWSLGVTFFEILIGRTPFEQLEGEEFNTKEQLHRYWTLTLRGKWVGKWSMSSSLEKLLRRMILPNADLRCTAGAAMADPYWTAPVSPEGDSKTGKSGRAHRKSSSFSRSPIQVDPRRIFDGIPYRQPRNKEGLESASSTVSSKGNKENLHPEHHSKNKDKSKERTRIPVAVDKENSRLPDMDKERSRSSAVLGLSRLGMHRHARTQSQAQAESSSGGAPEENVQSSDKDASEARKHAPTTQIPSLLGLGALSPMSPVKHMSPHMLRPAASATTFRNKDKENHVLAKSPSANLKDAASVRVRKPLGPRKQTPPGSPVVRPQRSALDGKENAGEKERSRKSRVLADRTRTNEADKENAAANVSGEVKQDSVRDRMREWERERQRLRELERVEERRREEEAAAEAQRRERELEEEMRRDIERQRRLEVELDRQREREAEMERMRARQAQALRERELQKELDAELQREREELEKQRVKEVQMYHQGPPVTSRRNSFSSTPPESHPPTPLSPLIEEPESRFYESEPRSANESSLSILKHGLKLSLDRTKRLYKSSTLALGLSNPALSINGEPVDYSRSRSVSMSTSWEEEIEPRSPLPTVHNAVESGEMAHANQLDRMTIWLKNVEKVVEDARQNFAASVSTPLPPLPVAPVSRPSPDSLRSQRSPRVARRILPANQIFVNEYDTTMDQSAMSSLNSSVNSRPAPEHSLVERKSMVDSTIPTIPSEEPSRVSLVQEDAQEMPGTPKRTRTRRATIVTRSPEAQRARPSLEIDTVSSNQKSKSQYDLGRPITPVTRLEFELEQLSKPRPTPKLSTLVDKSLFIHDPSIYKNIAAESFPPEAVDDSLTASPHHVEPYPARPHSTVAMDTPAKKHVEGVYDRFLMSTTGVKRVGQGYQSDNAGAIISGRSKAPAKRNPHFFLTSRRPMPPPVSSEDLRRKSMSADEFGAMSCAPVATFPSKEDGGSAVGIVKRAIKAMTVKR